PLEVAGTAAWTAAAALVGTAAVVKVVMTAL
ncbi:MAG: hypothetical protein JWO98_5109, partial [Frankiales bacterium]|nr:hypothetical protein [Frankiales bacterium]